MKDLRIDNAVRALWKEGELSFKLDSLQRSIRNTCLTLETDKILILSSRQIGKSFLASILGIELALKHPGSIVRVLAPTLKQVADIVQDNLVPICIDAPSGLIERSKSEYRWRIGKSSLRLGALERASVDNNRGGNADFVILEEGGFVFSDHYRYAVESVIGPQLLRSGGRELHISSPSEDSEHYLHTDILPYCEQRESAFAYTVYDSPSISERQIEKAIERCGGMQTEAFQREYMAKIIRSKSLMVIPEFDEDRHVKIAPIPEHYNALLSIDMGGVRDKTAGYICLWDFERGKMLVTHELFLDSNSPTSLVVDEAKRICEGMDMKGHLYADVPGQVQIDMHNIYDFKVAPPRKDDRDAGLNNLRLMFQRDEIEVHPRCKNLIGSLKSCRFNDKRTDFLRSDLWGHADAVMALCYGARLINRTGNPFPKPLIDRAHQISIPYRNTEHSELEKFAGDLIPWNPMTDPN